MTNEPEEPRPPTNQPNADDSTVTEIVTIRQELRELKKEVIGLRADIKNKLIPAISGQVASGIIEGLLLLFFLLIGLIIFFQLLLAILGVKH